MSFKCSNCSQSLENLDISIKIVTTLEKTKCSQTVVKKIIGGNNMTKLKAIEKEIETMDSFINRINEFMADKNVKDIQFMKTKDLHIICFISYIDYSTYDDDLPF